MWTSYHDGPMDALDGSLKFIHLVFQVTPRNLTYSDWLFTAKSEMFGFFPGWAMPTGVGLITVMTVIGMGAIPWIR